MNLLDSLMFPLTLCAALSCGLVAGTYFAFSSFVMAALARIHPSSGISAMQSINRTVLNPVFFTVFFGSAAVCCLLAGCSLLRWQKQGSAWLLAGAALYLTGNFIVTAVRNVPLNTSLAGIDPAKRESLPYWKDYLAKWSMWNHFRTVASLLAAAAFTVGLSRLP